MQTKLMAKVATVATGLAMATSMLALAPMAHAQTPSAAPTCTITSSLTMGSTGAEVICLQAALVQKGYLVMPVGVQMGYFGGLTKSAVAKWQSANNISPAVGYFGPISLKAFTGVATGGTSTVPGCTMPGQLFSSTLANTPCTSTTSTVAGCQPGFLFSSTSGLSCSGSGSTGTGALTGAGTLASESSLGDVETSLEVGDGSTKVVGTSFEASGGDVAIQRVETTMTVASNITSSSANIDKYVGEVALMIDGTKVATMNASAGTQSSTNSRIWTYRFSGLNSVVKKGTTTKIYVAVTPVTSIAATQDGESITAALALDSIRAVDASGISDTYGAGVTSAYTVSSATAGTLTASAASDNPIASQVAVASSTKTGVKLLSFNLKAKNQNLTVKTMNIELTTSDDDLNDVINNIQLVKGACTNSALSSKTIANGTGTYGAVSFSSLNEAISKDSTVNYTICADIKGDSAYADGTTLLASTTVASWTVADADGASVSPSAAVGGSTQTLTATGFSIALGTIPEPVLTAGTYAGDLSSAAFKIPFTVTAGDTAVFIGSTATATTSTEGKTQTSFATQLGLVYATTTSSTATTTTLSGGAVVATDGYGAQTLDANNNFYVGPNTSRSFYLKVTATASTVNTPGTPVSVGIMVRGINYSDTSTMGTTYYTSGLGTYRTIDVNVLKKP